MRNSPEAKTFQLPLNQLGSIRVEGGNLVITRRNPLKPFPEPLREDALRKWWIAENLSSLIQNCAQSWINNRGAQIAELAGVEVEQYSHEMTNDLYSQALHNAFEHARGRPFTAQDITQKLIHEARGLERKSASGIEWAPDYVKFLIDILSSAWNLSSNKTNHLKTTLYQGKLPQLD